MPTEISIEQIFHIMYKRLALLIVLPILFGAVTGVYSWLVMDDVYQASSTIIVSNQKSNSTTTATNSQLTYSDYNLNVSLVESYRVLCKTNRVLDQVIAQLGLPMTTAQLSQKISVEAAGETEIFHILVKDKDPVLAQNIVNTLTRVFQSEVKVIMKMDNVQIIDEAPLPRTPVEPNRVKNVVIGAAAGLVAAVGLAFLLEYLDRSVKSEEQVTEILGVPVLGVIPRVGKE
jgi:capsular polysaccharide biosynthesis protein